MLPITAMISRADPKAADSGCYGTKPAYQWAKLPIFQAKPNGDQKGLRMHGFSQFRFYFEQLNLLRKPVELVRKAPIDLFSQEINFIPENSWLWWRFCRMQKPHRDIQ